MSAELRPHTGKFAPELSPANRLKACESRQFLKGLEQRFFLCVPADVSQQACRETFAGTQRWVTVSRDDAAAYWTFDMRREDDTP